MTLNEEKCPDGQYYCNDSKKCKPIPKGHHVMPDGKLMKGEKHSVNEVAPPGFGHTKSGKGDKKGGTAAAFDRARKEGRFKGSKSDMFAIMWSQKNKGDKPHYKPGTDDKYKKYQKEEISRRRKPSAIKKRKQLDSVMNKYDDLKKKIGSKEKHMEPAVEEMTYQEMIDAGWEMTGEGIWWPPQPETVTEKISFPTFKKKVKERKPEKAQDAGAKARRKLKRKEHAKYVSGSEDNVPDDIRDHYEVSEGSLHKWFSGSKSKDGKPGWVQSDGSPCANEPGETKTPKCYSSSKRASMSKKELRSADARKSKKDPNQQQKSGAAKPTYVSTDKKKMKEQNEVDEACWKGYKAYGMKKKGGKMVPNCKPAGSVKKEEVVAEADKKGKGSGTKDACYHKVKARFKVWPSAYGSGALVKCRKAGAANWGNSKKEEVEYTIEEKKKKNCGCGKDPCITYGKQEKVEEGYQRNPERDTRSARQRRMDDPDRGINSQAFRDFMAAQQRPSKPKKKKKVEEGAAWTRKAGKNKEGGLNEKGRKSYERENPGSDLKAPQPEGGSRKKSFCARMGGMKKKLTSSKTANDPDSRINKALRKWKC